MNVTLIKDGSCIGPSSEICRKAKMSFCEKDFEAARDSSIRGREDL